MIEASTRGEGEKGRRGGEKGVGKQGRQGAREPGREKDTEVTSG
jgi:hypothetical protein